MYVYQMTAYVRRSLPAFFLFIYSSCHTLTHVHTYVCAIILYFHMYVYYFIINSNLCMYVHTYKHIYFFIIKFYISYAHVNENFTLFSAATMNQPMPTDGRIFMVVNFLLFLIQVCKFIYNDAAVVVFFFYFYFTIAFFCVVLFTYSCFCFACF